jgi:hypothetical protein
MISNNLREALINFSESIISPSELEEWVVARVHLFSEDSVDSDVIAAIELALAEISAKIKPQEELRRVVTEMLDKHTIVESQYPQTQTTTTTTSSSNSQPLQPDFRIIDTEIISTP